MRGNTVRKVELSNLRREGTPRLWIGDSHCNEVLGRHASNSGHVIAGLYEAALVLAQLDLCQPVVNYLRVLLKSEKDRKSAQLLW